MHPIYRTDVPLLPRVNGKAVPLQARSGPEGSRNLRFPDFVTTVQDGGRLSAFRTGRLYAPGNTPYNHFCSRLSRPQGHSAIVGIEPATFRFVAQHLNHCATAVPTPQSTLFIYLVNKYI